MSSLAFGSYKKEDIKFVKVEILGLCRVIYVAKCENEILPPIQCPGISAFLVRSISAKYRGKAPFFSLFVCGVR